MSPIQSYQQALYYLLPELLLCATILVTCLWNLFFPKLKEWTPILSIMGLVMAFGLTLSQFYRPRAVMFEGLFTVDSLTLTFSLIAVFVGMMVVMISMGYEHHFGKHRGEFYAVLLTATVSTMLLSGATNLILLFVALETLSICCVLLAGFSKFDVKSGEASLKYLLSTAAVTATLLYGLSFLYGLTGSTMYSMIAEKLGMIYLPPYALIKVFVLILVMSAIGFKLSMVPFHMWTPDVYEGAPTPVTAFLSIGSKAGGFVVALRLLLVVFGKATADWSVVLAALAILSMIMGNLIALSQKSFKRMLAYSSIAHVGYMLIGLIAANNVGLSTMVFYIIVYGFMNLGAFAGAVLFSNETGSDNIDDFDGYIRKRPYKALLLSLCLINLAGLPIPPAGFIGKLLIFGAGLGITTNFNGLSLGWLLVGIALLTSIPAVYYYTRVVIKMIVREPSPVVAALPERPAYLASPQEPITAALAVSVLALFACGTTGVSPVIRMSEWAVQPLVSATAEHATPQFGIDVNKVE
ncbi:MAG TPA: NADH-quinone oxidoreductase subunit NuoN [Oculatellaceae cyanobacterium]